MRVIGEIKKTAGQWDGYYLSIAEVVADGSKDPNRKVGAIVVSPDRRQVSFGYNGFPAGMPDLKSALADNDIKQAHMVHAEDNAIRQCPFPTKGCTLYITRFPCIHCAEKIVAAGIARVVAEKPDFEHPRWGKSWEAALDLMASKGIQVSLATISREG